MKIDIQSRLSRQGGFTLVELAIVLMIIGLLIGGVLRGQEMLNNARLQATIKQIQSYEAAVTIFRDAYSALPGDMISAPSRLPGCVLPVCRPGDGNNVVGTPVVFWQGGQQDIVNENTQFWKHLALARTISGVDPAASTPEWGRSHPVSKSPMPGGFTVITAQAMGLGSLFEGALVLRLHGNLTNNGVIEQEPSASPKQAAYLDRKMDDGIPSSGDVQARANGNGALVAACEVAYEEGREDPFCVMAFLLAK